MLGLDVTFFGFGAGGSCACARFNQRLKSGDEVVFAVAYQVGAAHAFEGIA